MVGLTLWVGESASRLAIFLLIAWARGNIFWDGLFTCLQRRNLIDILPVDHFLGALFADFAHDWDATLHSGGLSVKAFRGSLGWA